MFGKMSWNEVHTTYLILFSSWIQILCFKICCWCLRKNWFVVVFHEFFCIFLPTQYLLRLSNLRKYTKTGKGCKVQCTTLYRNKMLILDETYSSKMNSGHMYILKIWPIFLKCFTGIFHDTLTSYIWRVCVRQIFFPQLEKKLRSKILFWFLAKQFKKKRF